ncbi:uncharacterized protein [Diadema antillarum]|uniref:uncharacterized protein n=1 Tax=Diadema antillarum TaxID=105358 RepID=UPI003A872C2A
MKSVEPSADLPPASSHTMLTYSAMPVRKPYHHHRELPKNLTGAFLSHDAYGLPSNKQQVQRIPPLARPRGVVYQGQPSSSYHTRQQQHRHDVMVRKRGDGKGFQPLPIKRAKPKVPRHEYHSPSHHVISPRPDLQAVTRKSARNYVPASNDGVTHFEDLRSLSSGASDQPVQEVQVIESMLDSIDLASKESDRSLVGLVECYKRICKGNASSVHNLMAASRTQPGKHKKRKMPPSNKDTPLVIRSFRNPQNPHPVVQYSSPKDRPKSSQSASRPPVPAPYFYSSRGLPQTSDEGGNRVRLTRLPGTANRTSDAVLAAPGAGSISRSAGSRAGSRANAQNPPEGVEGTRPPSIHSNAKFANSDDVYALRDSFHVPASTPVTSVLDINKLSETEGGDHNSGQPRPSGSQPGSSTPSLNGRTEIPTGGDHNNSPANGDMELTSVTGESVDMMEGRGGAEAVAGGNDGGSMAIVISLEEEDGTVKTVDLEEEERKATESSSNHSDADEAAEKFKESQAKKQAELDQLLQEHQQIVSQIEELEKMKEGEDMEEEEEA